jgi:hypothetical protein
MMSAPSKLTLRTRSDDYSYQVAAIEDERFWFRLERQDSRDVITDFFIGSSLEQSAGSLLVDCYRVLGIIPKTVVVFENILPSDVFIDNALALQEARDFYAKCGEALLATLGIRRIDKRLEEKRGKYNLVLEAIWDVPVGSEQECRP